eukprot:TRINITY_DN2978_c0_g3_i1.p1 TRINITY_DN2978_c0_g3~~TRINITY_DN2978_c0_g3_i1.p1  ORF type:complete len:604 (-),score=89.90 TRINITY_DN2978_c0_g3_i1:70-1881(-)
MVSHDRVKKEFQRRWVLWVILNFSGGMKTLVNQSEQPFARSLVSCDVPVAAGNYTGSRLCGDRLKVIEEGFHISAKGQAQENFAMLCSLSFVGICIGAFGRRFTVLVGLGGTLLSVFLFVIASSSVEMGRLLFSLGQGLQGLYPVEYIFGIVIYDLTTQLGADAEAAWTVKFYEAVIGCIIWFGLGYCVQFAQLTEYGALWSAILALNIGMFALAFVAYPETKPASAEDAEKDGKEENAVAKLYKEVSSYGNLVFDYRCRMFLSKNFCQNIATGFQSVLMPLMLMAYHGWSQPACVTLGLGSLALGVLLSGVIEGLVTKYGYHDTYIFCIVYFTLALNLGTAICLPLPEGIGDKLTVLLILSALPLSGFFPMAEFVDSRFCDPDQMPRFKSAQWVLGYFQGIFILPLYAWFFNAEGKTYSERCIPSLIGVVFSIINVLVVFYGIYDLNGEEGFKFTLRQMDTLKGQTKRLFGILSRAAEKQAEKRKSEDEKSADKKDDDESDEAKASKEKPADAPIPVLNEEIWTEMKLKEITGKGFVESTGPAEGISSFEALSGWTRGLNTDCKAANKLIETLEKIIVAAAAYAGEEVEASAETPLSDKKKD